MWDDRANGVALVVHVAEYIRRKRGRNPFLWVALLRLGILAVGISGLLVVRLAGLDVFVVNVHSFVDLVA
jgi:hypothetical protein